MTAELFYWSLFALAVGVGMWGAVKQHGHTSIEDGGTLSLSSSSLADSAVTTAKLAADAVTTAKITDASVTAAKIASGVSATQAEMEAASSTTVFVSPGRLHFHPGVAKVWAAIFWSSGTPTGEASYNVTSYTDNGAGDVTVNFTTAFSSNNYSCVLGAGETDGNNRIAFLYAPLFPTRTRLTGSVRIVLFSGGTGQDQAIQMACYGDQ